MCVPFRAIYNTPIYQPAGEIRTYHLSTSRLAVKRETNHAAPADYTYTQARSHARLYTRLQNYASPHTRVRSCARTNTHIL